MRSKYILFGYMDPLGIGFRGQGLGFRVWAFGFKVLGLWFMFLDLANPGAHIAVGYTGS